MNFTQINYFLTVTKTLSFTKAASLLYISQPAISRQIIMMENELGFKLFTRANRALQLTPEGFVLATELSRVYMGYDDALSKARAASNKLSGQLRVGIVDGLDIDDMVAPTLKRMAADTPDIDIALFNFGCEETASRLLDGRLDIAFSKKYDIERRVYLEYKLVAEAEDMVAMAESDPMASLERMTFDDLRDTTLVMVSESEEDFERRLLLDICAQRGFELKLRFSPSFHANFLWIRAGLGVMILDKYCAMPTSGIKLIPFEKYKDPSLVLAWSGRNYNPARLKFEDVFTECNQFIKA